MVHPWPAPPPPSGPPPRLTRAQKWDLARMATAGVITVAALTGTAWMMTARGEQAGRGEGPPPRARAEAAAADRPVTVHTVDVLVPMTTPASQGPAGRRALAASQPSRRVPPPAARPAAAHQGSGSLPRRVTRFITGDGRHEVRPFPTVPDERR